MQQILDTLKQLIAIKSIMGEPQEGAPFGKEPRKALDFMLSLGEKMGFATQNVDGYAGHIEYGQGQECLGILCHLDVVPEGSGWTSDPYTLTEREGKLYGRGVVDNKGPAVVCLYALKHLKDSGFEPTRRIRLILGTNEENGSECIKYYKSKVQQPDIAFVPDADFPLINSEKLILRYEIGIELPPEYHDTIIDFEGGARFNMVAEHAQICLKKNGKNTQQILDAAAKNSHFFVQENAENFVVKAHGKSAHAMHPEQGINAISKIICLLNGVEWGCKAQNFFSTLCSTLGMTSLSEAFHAEFCDKNSGAQTINLGLVRQQNNKLIFTLDCRCPHTVTEEQLTQKLSYNNTFDVHMIYRADGLFVPKDSELVTTLLDIYAPYATQGNQPLFTGGGTYSRELDNAVAFGPTFEGQQTYIHDADEHMSLKQLSTLYEIYLKAIQRLSK